MTESDASPRAALLTSSQVILLLALVLIGRLFALYACPLYDDAFITFRYAENLARGAGMVFNPGAPWEPVLGTTTTGFTLLLSALLHLGASTATTAIALDITLDVASAAMIVALFRRRLVPTTVTLIVFAVLPPIARIGVGGMESPFLVALLLAGSLGARANRPLVTGIFVAIACTVRPEAVLFAVIFGFRFLRDWRALLRYSAVIAVVGVVSAGWLIHFYGSPIPQSVQAKSSTHGTSGGASDVTRMLEILQRAFLPSLYLLPLLPLVLIGLLRSFRVRDGQHLLGACAIAVIASYLAARPHTWGWYYYLPLVAWSLWLGLGVEALASRFLGRDATALEARSRWALPLLVGAAGIGAIAVIWPRPDLVTERIYRPLEEFATTNGLNSDVRVLASDIGAIAFFSEARILDSEGLTWPGALEYREEGLEMWDTQIAILDAERPEYVMFVVERPRLRAFRERTDLVAAYEPVARFNIANDHDLEPALEGLPNNWKQDYLLLKRR